MSPCITEKGQCANKFKLKIKNIRKNKLKITSIIHFIFNFHKRMFKSISGSYNIIHVSQCSLWIPLKRR